MMTQGLDDHCGEESKITVLTTMKESEFRKLSVYSMMAKGVNG
jgi:hypothetical protein